MSVLRPKDGDYITRGVFLLLGWFTAGWVPFAVAGALLAGAFGATIGFGVSIPIGVALYWVYLEVYPRRGLVPADGETLDGYEARQRAQFSSPEAIAYYSSRPATSTYVRGSRTLKHHGGSQ